MSQFNQIRIIGSINFRVIFIIVTVFITTFCFFCTEIYSKPNSESNSKPYPKQLRFQFDRFDPHKVQLPTLPPLSGHWEASLGFHVWSDHSVARNLQLRSLVYVLPGIRLFSVLRSNSSFDSIENFSPVFDELFLEMSRFYQTDSSLFSLSLKTGIMRYLRFPYPDRISEFDQVPGVSDIRLGKENGYRGLLLSSEYELNTGDVGGFGVHWTYLHRLFSDFKLSGSLEEYGFYRYRGDFFHTEIRAGRLLQRPEPQLEPKKGFNAYFGVFYAGFEAGVLYEVLADNEVYTGVLVEFTDNPINTLLGSIHFDYTRSPQGFGAQLPFSSGHFGVVLESELDRSELELQGEMVVERVITYWQNGQGRNFYEHILSMTGNTMDQDCIVSIEEWPWYLKIESLVSPHNSFQSWDDLVLWEKKRQGPAQLAQKVRYRYYKSIK